MRAVPARVAGGVAGVALCLLAGCSGSSPSVVRTPTVSAPAAVPPTPSTSALMSAPGSPTSSAPHRKAHPAITVKPARRLKNGQSVQVAGSGFTPDEPLIVVECADRGKRTGQGDCNLTGLASTSSDGSGHVRSTVKVVKGPFGANRRVCGAKQPCLISVSQASINPSEEADAEISFAAS